MIRILFVDDEYELLEIGKCFLETHPDFVVDTIQSAHKALILLKKYPYDVIISDYLMPEMDGLLFLKKAHEVRPDIPFIFFTGQGEEKTVIEALNRGAEYYLKKNYEAGSQFLELSQLIKISVSRARSEKSIRENENTFRTIADFSPDWTYWMGPDSSLSYVSPSCEKITGYTQDEFISDPTIIDRIVHPDDRQLWISHQETMPDGNSEQSLEFRIIHKEGDVRWISHTCQQVLDSSGVLLGVRVNNHDITAHREAEIRILKEHENFLNIFHAAPVGLLLMDKDLTVIRANDVIASMVLRDPADIIAERGGGSIGCIHRHESPQGCGFSPVCPECPLRKAIMSAVTGKIRVHGMICPMILSIGGVARKRWLNVSAEPVETNGSSLVIVAVDDITRQREMEEALKESEEHYRSLFEHMLEGYAYCRMIYDDRNHPVDWIYLKVNHAFEGLTGLKNCEGRWVTEVIPTIAELSPELFEIYHRVVTSGIPETFETRFLPLGIWLNISVYRVSADHFVAIFENITPRKESELALQNLNRDLRIVLENAPAMIWYKDTHNNILQVNPSACLVMGMPASSLVGKNLSEILPGKGDQYYLDDQEVIRSGIPKSGIIEEWTDPDGRKIWIEIGKVPVSDDAGKITGILVLGIDITERIRSKNAITLANKKLTLLSGITRHDLLNQVQGLFFSLEMALSSSTDPDVRTLLEKSMLFSQNIQRQLAFSRDYEKIGVNSPEWQDVQSVIDQAKKALDLGVVRFHNGIEGLSVYADPLLEKVFYNLIDNAIRYGRTITMLRFSGCEDSQGYILVCEDDGVGIAAEYKEAVFRREYFQHTGFGLNLSREILDITGLSIRETGEEGKGARFEITIPKEQYRLSL